MGSIYIYKNNRQTEIIPLPEINPGLDKGLNKIIKKADKEIKLAVKTGINEIIQKAKKAQIEINEAQVVKFKETKFQKAKNGVRRFLQLNEYDYECKTK